MIILSNNNYYYMCNGLIKFIRWFLVNQTVTYVDHRVAIRGIARLQFKRRQSGQVKHPRRRKEWGRVSPPCRGEVWGES